MIKALYRTSALSAAPREESHRAAALTFGKLFILCAGVALSAVLVKEMSVRVGSPAPLAMTETSGQAPLVSLKPPIDPLLERDAVTVPDEPAIDLGTASTPGELEGLAPAEIRYFDGRPVRPARTLTMTVTAYSPDERSCGDSADGITASLHHVTTNAHRLVAADSRVLPLGSIITVPGYDSGSLVPVLDRGGAIKGLRLDVLMPTHEEARRWGVRKVKVTVWEYADGGGNDWRKTRDSKK